MPQTGTRGQLGLEKLLHNGTALLWTQHMLSHSLQASVLSNRPTHTNNSTMDPLQIDVSIAHATPPLSHCCVALTFTSAPHISMLQSFNPGKLVALSRATTGL